MKKALGIAAIATGVALLSGGAYTLFKKTTDVEDSELTEDLADVVADGDYTEVDDVADSSDPTL